MVVTPQNKDQLTVVLNEESKLVDDIVVVGYGTQRRGMVSSAISKMVVDENNQRQVASPGQLLQGRVAGVISTTGSGNLGSGERMSIRGISSISAGNEPLYVIDGIPITNEDANIFNFGETMSSMATIAVNDIESIEVLKDAASAAIYGSRASNGVVLITTKSGREGKATLRLNFQAGISQFPNLRRVKMANSKQYIEAYNEGVDNYNRQYGYQVGDADYQVHIQNPFGTMPDTDWMKIGTQLGWSYNVDVSVSGGNAKTTYYVGGSYNDQTGVIRTNAMRKANLKAKVTQKFAKWLEVGANVSGNYMKNDQIPGSNIGSSILERLIHQRPIDHVYTPGGGYYTGGTPQLTFHNPVQILDEQIAYIENYRILGNFFAKFNFFDDKLQIQANYNADLSFTYDYTYYNENHPYGTGVGRLVEAYRHVPNTTFEVYANYNDKFGDVDFSAMLGHSYQDVTRKQNYVDVPRIPLAVVQHRQCSGGILQRHRNAQRIRDGVLFRTYHRRLQRPLHAHRDIAHGRFVEIRPREPLGLVPLRFVRMEPRQRALHGGLGHRPEIPRQLRTHRQPGGHQPLGLSRQDVRRQELRRTKRYRGVRLREPESSLGKGRPV